MSVLGQKLLRRRRQLCVYVIAGLFLCDFIFCGYIPSRNRQASLRETRTHQQRTIDMALAQGRELPTLKARLREAQRAAGRFDACVPGESEIGAFMQQITGIINEHHLTDQSVVPSEGVEVDALHCIPVEVACKGSLRDIHQFFAGLQALERRVRIQKVTLENDLGFSGQISMRIEAFIFNQSVTSRRPSGSADERSSDGANHET